MPPRPAETWKKSLIQSLLPLALLLLYLLALTRYLLFYHDSLLTESDPATVVQMVWLRQHHLPLEGCTVQGVHAYGVHFCASFLALVPLLGNCDAYLGLLTLHVTFCGVVAFLAYRFSQRFLEPVSAFLCTAALLLGPLLFLVFGMPTGYGIMGLAASLLFYYATVPASPALPPRKSVPLALLALFMMATSYETSLLIPIGLGLYWVAQSLLDALFKKPSEGSSLARGLITTTASVAILGLVMFKIIPAYRHGVPMMQLSRYDDLLHGQLPPVIANPAFHALGMSTLAVLLLSGGWLGFFRPRLWLTMVPGMAANFLSHLSFAFSIAIHYQITVIPGVFYTMLAGIQHLASGRVERQRRLAALCLALSLSSWALYLIFYGPTDLITEAGDRAVWSEAMAQIPAQGSVLMPARIVSHLGNREAAYMYPGYAWASRRQTEWVILDLAPIFQSKNWPTLESLSTRDILSEGNYQIRWRFGHLVVLQLGPGAPAGPQELRLPPLDPLKAGSRYSEAGSHGQAAAQFLLAARQHPREGALWAACGFEFERSNAFKEAHEAYRHALECTDLEPPARADIQARLDATAR